MREGNMRRVLNKKGDVNVNNTMEIVLAVIGIVLIAILVYKWYKSNMNQDEENAKNALNVVMAKIEAFEDNGVPFKFPLKGPAEWTIYGWSENDTNKPKKCDVLKSCICVCEDTTCKIGEFCECNVGVCREVNFEEVSVKRPEAYGVVSGLIQPIIASIENKCDFAFGIRFPNNLAEVAIDSKRSIIERNIPSGTTGANKNDINFDETIEECRTLANNQFSSNEKGDKKMLSLYAMSYNK